MTSFYVQVKHIWEVDGDANEVILDHLILLLGFVSCLWLQ